jgi:hypothetical protein
MCTILLVYRRSDGNFTPYLQLPCASYTSARYRSPTLLITSSIYKSRLSKTNVSQLATLDVYKKVKHLMIGHNTGSALSNLDERSVASVELLFSMLLSSSSHPLPVLLLVVALSPLLSKPRILT